MHAQTLEQQLQQTHDAVEALREANTDSSRGADALPAKRQTLKQVRLLDEPARKKRKTGHVSEKTSVEDEPELELMFEPDQSATPAAVKPTSQSGDDILLQAST